MPFPRPALPALLDQTAAEFESRLPGVLARVRRSLVGVIARVVAGGLWGLYGYAEYLDRNKWPDLADAEWLDWHGGRWGVTRKSAETATGTLRLSGNNGTVIPADTVLQRADGVQYKTTALGTITGGEALVAASAVLAGQAGNALANTTVTLTTPIGGVNSLATANTAMTGGSDTEGDEAYRARILLRVREIPHSGAAHDYEAWALEVPGVTRAWVYPLEGGPGTVTVRFVRDADPTFIPDQPEVAAVQAYIDARRPVAAAVTVAAPASQVVNFSIRPVPDTAEVRASITTELDAFFLRASNQPGGTLLLSQLREAISVSPGETDHTLFAPLANVVLPANTMAVRGAMTWVP